MDFDKFMAKKLGGKYTAPTTDNPAPTSGPPSSTSVPAPSPGVPAPPVTPLTPARLKFFVPTNYSTPRQSQHPSAPSPIQNLSPRHTPRRVDKLLRLSEDKMRAQEKLTKEKNRVIETSDGFFKPYNGEEEKNEDVEHDNDESIEKVVDPAEDAITDKTSTNTIAKKIKTSKQVRNEQTKPKVRTKTRAHQNWNERYLTNKTKS